MYRKYGSGGVLLWYPALSFACFRGAGSMVVAMLDSDVCYVVV